MITRIVGIVIAPTPIEGDHRVSFSGPRVGLTDANKTQQPTEDVRLEIVQGRPSLSIAISPDETGQLANATTTTTEERLHVIATIVDEHHLPPLPTSTAMSPARSLTSLSYARTFSTIRYR